MVLQLLYNFAHAKLFTPLSRRFVFRKVRIIPSLPRITGKHGPQGGGTCKPCGVEIFFDGPENHIFIPITDRS